MPRPKFEPSAEQRKTVEVMAAYGIPEEQIARTIGARGIDAKTLRKHFRRELSVAATMANSKVAQTLYQMATSGKQPAATMFWLKCRAGWKENSGLQQSASHAKPVLVAHADLDKGITAELARVAAAAKLAVVSGKLEPGTETSPGPQVEGLEGQA